MTPQPQAATLVAASTPQQARELAERMMQQMTALLGVIGRETDLVRAGDVRDASRLAQDKAALSQGYLATVALMKISRPYLAATTPELLGALQSQHETLRNQLQVNLAVLATAHAVSEGIVRGVNLEIQKRNAPQTYSASGQRCAPPARHVTPLALSRSL